MITISHSGDFKNTEKFLSKSLASNYMSILNSYGKQGVSALQSATPTDSGQTATSWSYTINRNKRGVSIVWNNSNIVNGVNVAVVLQYGHATSNGGYVKGRDYINPAIMPIFDRIAEDLWKEVTNG